MKKNFKGGFTLIELLVVIAIIGILASVVLASLNTARAKGADANIKANLANARAQAELYYDGNTGTASDSDLVANTSGYTGVCATAGNGIKQLITAASTTAGIAGGLVTTGVTSIAVPYVAVCNDSQGSWAAAVPLKTAPGTYYCVDSTGASKTSTITTTSPNTVTNCV